MLSLGFNYNFSFIGFLQFPYSVWGVCVCERERDREREREREREMYDSVY